MEALFTCWDSELLKLGLKSVSPPYDALIEWDPAERDDIAGELAIPPVRDPDPINAAPSKNWTVPVGVPAAGLVAFTVARKVTGWPKTEGLIEDTMEVAVDPVSIKIRPP